jgi:prepilin-type N-terminal cleavage/methylation domain-containing protein
MNRKPRAFSLIELSIAILVIGILVAGVVKGSRLMQEFNINTARTLTQSSDVNSIKDLVLWLDATDEDSLKSSTIATITTTDFGNIEDESRISAWQDRNLQLAKKIIPLAPTDDSRPIYIRQGIDGIPSLRFDDGHFMQSTGLVPLEAGDDSYTMAFVIQFDEVTGTNNIIAFQGPDAFTTSNTAGIRTGNTNKLHFWGEDNDYSFNAITIEEQQQYIVIIRIDNEDNPNVSIHVNTTDASTGNSNNRNTLNVSADNFSIGATSPGSNTQFHGLISEILYYDRALRTSEITAINNYLAKKYNVTLN